MVYSCLFSWLLVHSIVKQKLHSFAICKLMFVCDIDIFLTFCYVGWVGCIQQQQMRKTIVPSSCHHDQLWPFCSFWESLPGNPVSNMFKPHAFVKRCHIHPGMICHAGFLFWKILHHNTITLHILFVFPFCTLYLIEMLCHMHMIYIYIMHHILHHIIYHSIYT